MMDVKKSISTNMWFYKSERLELAYYDFEEGYIRDVGDIFVKPKRIKKGSDYQNIRNILLRFGIPFDEKDEYFEVNTYSLIYLYFIVGLLNLGLSVEKVKEYYKAVLDSWQEYHNWEYLFAFYIYQVIAGYEANFYISKTFSLLLVSSEFSALKSLDLGNEHMIIISLNNILGGIFNKDYPGDKNKSFHLNDKEIDVLAEMRLNYNKLDINLSFKDGCVLDEISIKEPLTKEDLEDLDKVANDKDFGAFEDLNFHRGKISSGKVIKKKRFDK